MASVNANLAGYFGIVSDGRRYVYFGADGTRWAARVDTFNWPTIEFMDMSVAPFSCTGGCLGMFSDGKHAYMTQSFNNITFAATGKLARFQLLPGGSI